MLILVNGSEIEVPAECTVSGLLEIKNLAPSTVVIEINGDIAKSEQWENIRLAAGDRLEIIRFVGGG